MGVDVRKCHWKITSVIQVRELSSNLVMLCLMLQGGRAPIIWFPVLPLGQVATSLCFSGEVAEGPRYKVNFKWLRFKNRIIVLLTSGWKKIYDQYRQHIKKQRYYFANKGLSSQTYGFSSGHVWMWELDPKESWALKNCCFWTVVLEKTLESPLDCKEIQPVHPKGNQSWIFIGRTDAEAVAPILWPPYAKSRLM